MHWVRAEQSECFLQHPTVDRMSTRATGTPVQFRLVLALRTRYAYARMKIRSFRGYLGVSMKSYRDTTITLLI